MSQNQVSKFGRKIVASSLIEMVSSRFRGLLFSGDNLTSGWSVRLLAVSIINVDDSIASLPFRITDVKYRYRLIVPSIPFYSPPLEFNRITDAVRRGKRIAAANPGATVDVYRSDGEPIFALGASVFGGCCPSVTPHRCWAEFVRLNCR